MTTHKHGHYHIVGISEFHWHCNKFTLLKIKCSRSAFKHRLFTLSYTWIEFPIIWSELPSLEGDSCRAAAELCTVVKAFVSGSQQLPIHVQGLSQARQLHKDISVARGRHCRAAEGLKQLPGIKTPRLSSNPALLSHLPYTKENSYINNFKGKYKPGKMCHCSRTHFWDTEKRPGAARCVPVNALGLFGLCRRAQSALAAGKWELTALPGHQQLLFTALQNPQPAEQGDHTPGYQHKSSAFLFAGIFYNMQSQAVITFQARQTEKSPCATAACCEKTRQALCFAPRKAHLLIKCRNHCQQGVYWESHDRSYLFELVRLTWGHSKLML